VRRETKHLKDRAEIALNRTRQFKGDNQLVELSHSKPSMCSQGGATGADETEEGFHSKARDKKRKDEEGK